MSHISKVKTQLRSRDIIEKVLKKMGMNVEKDCTLSLPYAYGSEKSMKVDLGFGKKSSSKSLGVRKQQDGTFEVVGDYYMTGIHENSFVGDLTQSYGEEQVKTTFETNPDLLAFNLSKREVDANGDIILTYEAW